MGQFRKSVKFKMPKSKRDRKVALSKTTKKVGLETKQAIVDKIRSCVDTYPRLFVFSTDNMRNLHFQKVRDMWKEHSTFIMGKNRVMSLALGRDEPEEYANKLHNVSRLLRNQRGLLFTSRTGAQVLEFFSEHSESDFLRTGGIAEQTVTLESGALEQFSHAIEPQLRQLGMPTELKKGIVTLNKDYTVCNAGDQLNSEQARILKLFGHQQAKFKLNMIAIWSKEEETFKMLKDDLDIDNNDMMDDNDEADNE